MSSESKNKVLVVEDEELMRKILRELLEGENYEVFTADNAENALEVFRDNNIDVTVTDIKMSGMDGIGLLDNIKGVDENALVVIITAYSSVDTAVAALRKGAYDYVTKPFVNDDLLQTVKNAIRTKSLFNENRALRRELNRQFSFSQIIGTSNALQGVFRLVEKVANTDASVMIQGESGTGKELIARSIHQHSSRSGSPFVGINCGALPAELLESELFGHVKGSFTGAHSDRSGLFRAAESGTLFLDEIGEMPITLQVKLLRALQEQEVRPVGATNSFPFDARILAATNKELENEVNEGNFREDLFYRLNVIEINVPPLRERREDIPLLIKHFLGKAASNQNTPPKTIAAEAMSVLTNYRWPGNVRELENAVERATILCEDEIKPEHLPGKIRESSRTGFRSNDPESFRPTLEEKEREYISEILDVVDDDKSRAARMLGIDLSTLYRKLKKYSEDQGL